MKKVKVIEYDGEWFVIPNELYSKYISMSEDIESAEPWSDEYYEFCDAFEAEFEQYKTGGDLNNTQLYIK